MLRFSLYAMTQPMQFTIFRAEILANQFESSALVAGNLYEQFAGAGVDRRHLITESGDQRQCALSLSKGNQWPCALSLSKGNQWPCAQSLSKGTDYRLATPAPGFDSVAPSSPASRPSPPGGPSHAPGQP
jgi:hypothetical protein